jgi:hypothetical protein
MVSITSKLPELDTAVRSMLPPKVQLHLGQNCHRYIGLTESLASNCPVAVSDIQSAEILDQLRIHPTLRPALVHWMSTIVVIRPTLNQQVLGAQAAITFIDAQLD